VTAAGSTRASTAVAFVVVVSRRGTRIPDSVLALLRDRACSEVPFAARQHVVWDNEGGSVAFGGWQDAPDAAAAAHHWHIDDEGITAFAGHVWPRRDGWPGPRPWAEQLAGHLRSTPLRAGADDLTGVFVAASLHRRGRGAIAADPFGIGHVYWGTGRDIVAIASRAALAAAVLGAERVAPLKRDVLSVGWLAYAGAALGLDSGYEQVSVIPEGALLDIDPGVGVQLIPAPRPPWKLEAHDEVSPQQLLEEARHEMLTSIRMARTMGDKTRAELTGGRDSRLLAALLLADGSAGEVEFQTLGREDLPDVIVAKQIAERFGLRHVVDPDRAESWAWQQALHAAVRDHGHADASWRELALRMTSWATSGVANVAQHQIGHVPARDSVLLSGMWAETFRSNYPLTTRYRSKAHAAEFPITLGLGAAGILRPDALAHYRREIHRQLFDRCVETDSPQDVVDGWYIRLRYRRWVGANCEVDVQNRAFPLISITAVRLAFAIGAENRHAEWIHHQLMEHACEPLVHMPYVERGWSAGAGGELVRPRTYRDSVPAAPRRRRAPRTRQRVKAAKAALSRKPPAPLRTAARDHRTTVAELDLDIMRRFLRHDPSNRVFEILDPAGIERALDGFANLTGPRRGQLYGALSAAIWLGASEIALPRERVAT
jgi:hypothetical protein